jgi:hypothetical protein
MMTFLAEHHERLNQQEPRWIVITLVRIASTAFLCLAVLMFSLCLSWLSGVQWVWESQPVRAETAYYLFMGGVSSIRRTDGMGEAPGPLLM